MHAKKSLGQNFLKSALALSQIVGAAKLTSKDTVLEIGPGKGALTEKLLEAAGQVIAIEKDRELVKYLEDKFKIEIKNKKLILLEADILEFDLSTLRSTLHVTRYALVANIPYYITGAIIRKFLTSPQQPTTMVLLVQKEVAERIVTRDKKESLLSLSVKAYGTPRYVAKVGRRYFSPAPRVDSAIVAIENISRKNFESIDEERFFDILHAGFAHKRKVLQSNLKDLTTESGVNLGATFDSLSIPHRSRAENLTLQIWLALTKLL